MVLAAGRAAVVISTFILLTSSLNLRFERRLLDRYLKLPLILNLDRALWEKRISRGKRNSVIGALSFY